MIVVGIDKRRALQERAGRRQRAGFEVLDRRPKTRPALPGAPGHVIACLAVSEPELRKKAHSPLPHLGLLYHRWAEVPSPKPSINA
jgi:hypothetical protein